jgi:hypothetical protein
MSDVITETNHRPAASTEAGWAEAEGAASRPEAAAAVDAVLYDAGATQRVPFAVEYKGRTFTLHYNFAPLTDEVLKEYDRLRDVRLAPVDANLAGQKGALETKINSFAASVWLWNELALSVEGIGRPGDPMPEDWKSRIDDRDKAGAIDDALLACQIVPPPASEPGEYLPWEWVDDTSTVYLKAVYAGHEVLTEHVLRKPSKAQVDEYRAFTSSSYLVQGQKINRGERRIPPRAAKLGRLYDALVESTGGYRGAVPLHHKTIVVQHHLDTEQEALTGN